MYPFLDHPHDILPRCMQDMTTLSGSPLDTWRFRLESMEITIYDILGVISSNGSQYTHYGNNILIKVEINARKFMACG